MLKKYITLLIFTAQASMHAADQTNLVYIDIKKPATCMTQSTISMPITDDTTFAELQTNLNKAMSCPIRIENGLRYHDVDYMHPDYDFLIDARDKVKDSRWCSSYYRNAKCNLIAFLPRPSITNRVMRKDVV